MLKIHSLKCIPFYGFNIHYQLEVFEDAIAFASIIRGLMSLVNEEEATPISPETAYIQTLEHHATILPDIIHTASYKTPNATQKDYSMEYVEFGATNAEDIDQINKAHRKDFEE